MGWVVNATPRPLYPQQWPGTHCIGGWVGRRESLAGAENIDPTEIRSPNRSSMYTTKKIQTMYVKRNIEARCLITVAVQKQ
jgi:hypothetical protein